MLFLVSFYNFYSYNDITERMITLNNNNNKSVSREELERQMKSIDRSAVEKKLRQMGMKDVADKLSRTSNEEILRMLAANPDIIKRINQIMGGENHGR